MPFRTTTLISRSSATLILICLALPGCGRLSSNRSQEGSGGANTALTTGSSATGNQQQEILAAQQDHARKVEVTVDARVDKKLPDDTKGLPHERFLIRLGNGTRVLVAHDTKMAPYVPLQAGDTVRIHGEYIWNEQGGVLHWTHHANTGRHEGGWIDYAGQRYQ